MSEVTELFNEGLEMYYKEYYRNALRKFERAEKLNKSYPLLGLYLANSKDRIGAGADRQSILFKAIIVFAMGLIFFVVIYLFYPKLKVLVKKDYSSSK